MGIDDFKCSRPLPLPARHSRRHARANTRPRDWKEIRKFLTKVATGEHSFDSLTSAARALHLEPSQVYAHFPDLCRQIAKSTHDKRDKLLQEAHQKREAFLSESVSIETTRMISEGEYPTVKKLLQFAKLRGLGVDKTTDRRCIRGRSLARLSAGL